jgi:hypothetical protein
MPTRRKQDSFDVMSAVFARLPWWAPFLLAALAWFLVPPIGRAVVHQKAWDHVWPMVAGLFTLVLVLTGIAGQFEKARRRRVGDRNKIAAPESGYVDPICDNAAP